MTTGREPPIAINQFALEAAVMELTLWVEQSAAPKVGDKIRGALESMGKTQATLNRTWPNSEIKVSARQQLPEATLGPYPGNPYDGAV